MSSRTLRQRKREFKQIATAGADTAAGSKFPQKCGTAHVRRLHPTVADRAEKRLRMRHLRPSRRGSAGKSRLKQQIPNVKSITER